MRKILHHAKSNRINGYTKAKIGCTLPIVDKHNVSLSVGDTISYGIHVGILLYNPSCDKYGIALTDSLWYGDNPYDMKSYGKFIPIPLDNGAKMELLKHDT